MASKRSMSSVGVGLLIGMSLLASTPAMAAGLVSPVSVTGTLGAPNCGGYSIYEPKNAGPFYYLTQNNTGSYSVDQALVGSAGTAPAVPNPGGNVELCDGISTANFGPAICLSGAFPSGDIVQACSLTAADWQTVDGSGKTLARRYYEGFFAAYPGLETALNGEFAANSCTINLFDDFFDDPSYQIAFSAPNISYVNQNGDIKIGLAGLFNATPGFAGAMAVLCPGFDVTVLAPYSLQASQVAKVQINGGNQTYLYGFQATPTGRYADADGNPATFDQDCLTNLVLYAAVYGTVPTPATPFQVCSYSGNYEVSVGFDFGDLPDQYGTLQGSNGARHYILPATANVYLGTIAPDDEGNGQPTAGANGDNADFVDDEDGVTFPPLLIGTTVNVLVNYVNTMGQPAYLNAWLDTDGDGVLEQIATDVPVAANSSGQLSIPVSIPANATPGPVYSRFRISSQQGLGLTGPAPDGEVEDYVVELRRLPEGIPIHGFWLGLLGLALTLVSYRQRRQSLR